MIRSNLPNREDEPKRGRTNAKERIGRMIASFLILQRDNNKAAIPSTKMARTIHMNDVVELCVNKYSELFSIILLHEVIFKTNLSRFTIYSYIYRAMSIFGIELRIGYRLTNDLFLL